jgi:hypothetical protein
MNDPKIGLICKSHNYTTSNGNVTSGDWVISSEKIGDLVGEDIILTEGSDKAAYTGGQITGYNRLPSGKYVIFFNEDSGYDGYNAHVGSWAKGENPVRYL